jgi:chromosome partitioning protein
MASMKEGCSICGREFEVQFRYQMEESRGGFAFYCSQTCQQKGMEGEHAQGVACDVCAKRFQVELVSQMVRTPRGRQYACSEGCRTELLGEVSPLAAFTAPAPASTPSLPRAKTEGISPEGDAFAANAEQAPLAASAPEAPERKSVPAVASASDALRSVAPGPAGYKRKPFAGPRHLAIFNHKGGTGKTTTTVSIAAGLAARGLRVLLVDTDSQGNVAVSLGVKLEKTLYHVLVMGVKPEDVAIQVRPNLDFIGSNETLAAAELYLAGRQNRDRILRERLARAASNYDVVLIDCSPSLSLMNQNALVLADGVLVPVACDFLSLVGVRQVVRTVQIHGVLPTFYDARAKICREAYDTMREHFGPKCLAPIRSATKLKEAPSQGKTIFEYAPESNAAEDYLNTIEGLISGVQANHNATDHRDSSEDGPETFRASA